MVLAVCWFVFFFFNDTATTEIYTLSLHDALPICNSHLRIATARAHRFGHACRGTDRKSTRLNSSHLGISYAVFCLKKKLALHPTQASQRHDGQRNAEDTSTLPT